MSLLRSAGVLISGKAAGFAVRFARNVLLARLLTVAEYGTASTLIMAMSLVSMTSDLDFGKYIQQNRKGDDPDFIAAIKTMQVMRGALMGLALFALAWPMAQLFGQPDLVWAYQFVGVIPLIWAVMHPDLDRFARNMNFLPRAINNVVSGIVGVAAIWPLVQIFGDYRAVLGLLVVEGLCQLFLSFLQAERPFRMRWNGAVARGALLFGWPLMVSGLLLYAIQQGDRIVVASFFGAVNLGYFSAALNLVMPAVLTSAQLVRAFFLPLLARVQDETARFDHRALFAIQSSLCATQLAVLGFAFLGPPVIVLVYGQAYEGAGSMVALIGMAISFQLARAGTATAAIARGYTLNMLYSNLVRIAFLPVAVGIAFLGGTIPEMLMAGVIGQIVAYWVSLELLHRRSGMGGRRALRWPMVTCTAGNACLLADVLSGVQGLASVSVFSAAASALFLAQIATSRVMLTELEGILRKRLRRPPPGTG